MTCADTNDFLYIHYSFTNFFLVFRSIHKTEPENVPYWLLPSLQLLVVREFWSAKCKGKWLGKLQEIFFFCQIKGEGCIKALFLFPSCFEHHCAIMWCLEALKQSYHHEATSCRQRLTGFLKRLQKTWDFNDIVDVLNLEHFF